MAPGRESLKLDQEELNLLTGSECRRSLTNRSSMQTKLNGDIPRPITQVSRASTPLIKPFKENAESQIDYNLSKYSTQLSSVINFTEKDLKRLKELRLKETEYTESELEFMYKIHK